MKTIHQTLMACRAEGRSALIPYLTAGVPDLKTSARLLHALAKSGADLIELGVPFSDPVADGPVIQKASEKALAQGVNLSQILDLVAQVRSEGLDTPLILFSYYNPIYHLGLENFVKRAQEAGVSGTLIVDLLPETAGRYLHALEGSALETVFLAAPTTAPERLAAIDQASSACIYYVSRTGVTGTREQVHTDLPATLATLKNQVKNPIIVGFGISKPEHVATLKGAAEGIVVGSALMAALDTAKGPDQAVEIASALIRSLKHPLEEN
ncbi:tryptophan synthase subunit alpha [bacterium (Candidatus Blackallbacteria) CG17_big_fil_post_rev_8_21_14_2_50_48_46]|uniref:Tryptophan synthase alpha chain n=1 Tax=bacterium (Candidatus Blackallbacteria) CG17_big_fil_post_rev_8_21_14_2_50_48_46 TaxID=2014261 RepID=A0A2M7FYP2_9BACT|nr:MAG: tryptophan synthase subunit alpha [bacterium (Candidatus Blackallbacteria) CG18_big_fil_WC_8_21_14_2_50_49_26]PIW14309.1 MAG: tryptophan synthase subunit alpha [bacterium (Candidatus Blackallbacteria) CG17_big_fil_post_rev_8_21_14_2_50_48_46]PIW45578.1 MAG: tryptophan synthase subunit alpha [bacterium (Candidatus Blackallbacteria) CG13_big_fil_rev_8_21_14_2_50_49_14]